MLTSHRVRRHVDQTMGQAVVDAFDALTAHAGALERLRIVTVVPVNEYFVDMIVSNRQEPDSLGEDQ